MHVTSVWSSKIAIKLLLALVVLVSCDRISGVPSPARPAAPYTQYGTPFENVPEPQDVVLYEINPLVFSSSRDLQGIIPRLDSIKALGVNTLWIMPIYEMGIDRSVGSPYCIKDYLSIRSDFGDLDDLRTLVEKAHEKDMAVLLDWVANHTSWDHVWMQDSSYYVRENGSIVHPPGTGWTDVAELDYNNLEMRSEMISAMKYWVLEANVDGYRCDYAGGVPNDFWKAAIDSLRDIPGRDLIMFAESDQYDLLDEGFDLSFSWSFYGSCWNIWNIGAHASTLFQSHQDELALLPEGKTTVRFLTNHDQHAWDGTPETIFGSNDAAFGVFIAATTMGGVPLIYNGQEKALPYQLPFFTPTTKAINWGLNVVETVRHRQLMDAYWQFDALRGNQGRTGLGDQNIIAFTSKGATSEALVGINPRGNTHSIELPESWKNRRVWDIFTQDSLALGTNLTLSASGYAVLIQ